ncbi:hypothetical protein JTE90_012894 [Oedothorax gibbosus]|uniref:Helitron helicase-like domain-containing protein n=1 Tax=Oedothorax gibbosus TaxID=931172 RepID=A0AAV6TN42_9ARAC|nr:hypothetical protein JTE90_012894 [Oedothorax gibbosus]
MHIVTKKELSKSELYKSILRRRDRRAAESTEFILFAAKVLEINRITSNHSVCLRKRKRDGEQVVTAQLTCNKDYVDGMLQDDNAFRVLQGVRNSSHHWHQEGLRVRAMVRQFGLPHIFLTISAAEIKWLELIVILKKVLDCETINEEQAREISDQHKATLIQRDPITCVRYFDNRVEFQHRESQHVHMIIWLSDAPIYIPQDEDNNETVCKFIDEIITCSTDYDVEDPIYQLLPLNTHRHTHTCRKKCNRGVKCRFGIPFFPMDKTRILSPITPSDGES